MNASIKNDPTFFLEGVVHEKSDMVDFEGPLSLILLLLSKNKIEIRDIPISEILEQYLAYLEEMKEYLPDAEYLVYEGGTHDILDEFPEKLAADIHSAGFDLMTVTSNHAADAGAAGFNSTIKAVKKAGLIPSGGQLKDDDPDYAMTKTKDGVKIAFISYSYNDGTPETPALNGNVLPEEMVKKCNTFSMKDKKGAVKDAARIEKEARKAGADIVILSLHWGEEYQTHSNADQQKLAQMYVDGTTCDLIVGSHPHVVQEYDLLKSKDGKRKVPCFYAIGNLLSNQRRELVYGDKHVEEGVITMFRFDYDTGLKKLNDIGIDIVPYWVNLYYGDTAHYDIVPLIGKYKENKSLIDSGNASLAADAKKEIKRILNQDYDLYKELKK